MNAKAATARVTAALVAMVAMVAGCKSIYYSTWETLGKHKRDLLVDRVEDARSSQQVAKEQFKDALEKFRGVVGGDDPATRDLETRYRKFSSELEDCESRADDVSKRIVQVREVSGDLFKEWEKELAQYSNADLRRRSQDQLRQTRQRYDQLIAAMEAAEGRMEPVLAVLRDQVLFLKHNLNARAVASLQSVAAGLEADTNRLIADMERAIAQADAFIKDMGSAE